MNLTFRPISVWPGVLTKDRIRSQFKARYSATLELLDRELVHLGAERAVLELDIQEADLRLDGMIRANARPTHPGVVVSFDSKHGPLRYATDLYDDWHSNLRAIALGLEALRKVDRYGITKTGEQYAGWRALTQGSEEPMTREEALMFLADSAGWTALATGRDVERAYRAAAKRLHPDTGGNAAGFDRLKKAKALLDAS